MRQLGAILALGVLCLVLPSEAAAQDCGDLYNPFQVLNFYVTMDPADWELLRHDCPGGYCGERPHDYFQARFRCEDGPEIEVGIPRKNGLAEPSEDDPQKPPLRKLRGRQGVGRKQRKGFSDRKERRR